MNCSIISATTTSTAATLNDDDDIFLEAFGQNAIENCHLANGPPAERQQQQHHLATPERTTRHRCRTDLFQSTLKKYALTPVKNKLANDADFTPDRVALLSPSSLLRRLAIGNGAKNSEKKWKSDNIVRMNLLPFSSKSNRNSLTDSSEDVTSSRKKRKPQSPLNISMETKENEMSVVSIKAFESNGMLAHRPRQVSPAKDVNKEHKKIRRSNSSDDIISSAVSYKENAGDKTTAKFNIERFHDLEMAKKNRKKRQSEEANIANIFKGVVAFVEIIIDDDYGRPVNYSSIIENDIIKYGGEVLRRMTMRITHVIFDNGRESVWRRIIDMRRAILNQKKELHIVNSLWPIESLEQGKLLDLTLTKFRVRIMKPEEDLRALLPTSKKKIIRRIESIKKFESRRIRKSFQDVQQPGTSDPNQGSEKPRKHRRKLVMKTPPERKSKVTSNVKGQSSLHQFENLTQQVEELHRDIGDVARVTQMISTQRGETNINYVAESQTDDSTDLPLLERIKKKLAGNPVVENASPFTRAMTAHGPSPLALNHSEITNCSGDILRTSNVNNEPSINELSNTETPFKQQRRKRKNVELSPISPATTFTTITPNMPAFQQETENNLARRLQEENLATQLKNKENKKRIKELYKPAAPNLNDSLRSIAGLQGNESDVSSDFGKRVKTAIVLHRLLSSSSQSTSSEKMQVKTRNLNLFETPPIKKIDNGTEGTKSTKNENYEEDRLSSRKRGSKMMLTDRLVPSKRRTPKSVKCPIVLTSMNQSDREACLAIVYRLGDYCIKPMPTPQTKHTVLLWPRTTLNVLYAITYGAYLLKVEWIYNSLVSNRWLNENDYELPDQFPGAVKRRKEREEFNRPHRLFTSPDSIYISQDCKPSKEHLSVICAYAGLTVVPTVQRASIVLLFDGNDFELPQSQNVAFVQRNKLNEPLTADINEIESFTNDRNLLSPAVRQRYSYCNEAAETSALQKQIKFIASRWVIDSLIAGDQQPITTYELNVR